MSPPKLLLASTSRYRRELLSRLGIPFEAIAPTCDEEALKLRALSPEQMALYLASEKARSVAQQHPDAFVIGSDQLVELDGQRLGKPHSQERALEQLMSMRGKSHQLLTALCLECPTGEQITHLDRHVLTMPMLPEESLRRYVDADDPLDCAGSYKIEARGIALFERIQGEDFTAITGLPLIALTRLLRERGFSVP
jgi:septum formation protein